MRVFKQKQRVKGLARMNEAGRYQPPRTAITAVRRWRHACGDGTDPRIDFKCLSASIQLWLGSPTIDTSPCRCKSMPCISPADLVPARRARAAHAMQLAADAGEAARRQLQGGG